ncbi:MAG: NUDIX domain-containing protein [Chloroflexota bacterium]
MPAQRGPWQVLDSRAVYANPWITVREDRVIQPDGRPGIYGVVQCNPAVGVVALTAEGQVCLVGQYRYPLDEYSWEIVTGYSEPGEDVLAAAQRELREETGLTATRWTSLGRCHISNSVTDQVGYLYLAEGLEQGAAAPEPTEELSVKVVPLAEALALAQSSGIVQAFSLVGLYRAAWQHPLRLVAAATDGPPAS